MKVLVVDDAATKREVAEEILRRAGHVVTSCADGQEALDLIFVQKYRFDVMLDFLMPKVDGLVGAQQLRAYTDTRDVAIVYVSALASKSDVLRGLAAGCDYYVTKPYRRKDLLDALERTCPAQGGRHPPL